MICHRRQTRPMAVCGIAAWMFLLALSGCTHGRAIRIVHIPEPDAGIQTQARYRVERIGMRAGGSVIYFPASVVEEFRSIAERKHDGVFSRQGIPVTLVRVAIEDSSDYSFLLWFLSCQILPARILDESLVEWEIIIDHQVGKNPSFEVNLVDECYLSCLSPLAALVPLKEVEAQKQSEVFTQDYLGVITRADKINKDALSYGVASRLMVAEASGEIEPVIQAWRRLKQHEAERTATAYTVVDCRREDISKFIYSFTVKLHGVEQDTLKAFRNVQKKFREEIKSDYLKTFEDARGDTLYVDFPQYGLKDGLIVGKAEVFAFTSAALSYDSQTRRGKLSVAFDPRQYESARSWVRKNIETLARDKNIALVTGQLPPAATYYSLGEKVDGNVMEIEFKTE